MLSTGYFHWRRYAPMFLASLCAAVGLLPAQTPPDTDSPKLDPLKESITVNANIATEAPASIVEIRRLQLQEIPGINLDDRLRTVPGFSMFRRASSLAAN